MEKPYMSKNSAEAIEIYSYARRVHHRRQEANYVGILIQDI